MSDDLRGWLQETESMGELSKVAGADWNLEIGCLSMLNGRRRDGPALLFEKIKGYAPDYRLVTCSTAKTSRIAHLFGFPVHFSDMDLVAHLRQSLPRWENELAKFPIKEVPTGPVLENVFSGKDIDLLKFPVPQWHELDGGRYIGTGDAVITRDPDTGVVNLGTYRIMVHDRNTVALFCRPGTHGRLHYEKWHARGQPCPVAVSVGHHPLVFRMACTSVPDEYAFMGAVRQKPVGVIREEVTGLPIPADSEIVLAGWCPPGELRPEGPFGEWLGYYSAEAAAAPVIKVERVYHRHAPILLGAPPARPPHESAYYRSLLGSAILHNELEKAGIPDVRGVWLSEAAVRLMIIISIKQRYAGHAKQVALFAASHRHGESSNMNRYVIVVDEDVDPSNIQDVVWALCTRSDPEKDIDIIRRTWSSSLDPLIRRPAEAFFNSRALIDACKPFEWLKDFPKEIAIDPELATKVKRKWSSQLKL